MDPDDPAPTPPADGRPSATFSTGEGKSALASVALAFLTFAAQKADLLEIDAIDRKILLGGMFLVVCCLIVARGLSKNGTGL